MALPGVKVGPLDPDRTAEFGQVSGRNSARQLIRLHMQAHPRPLVQALSRKLDPERTKALLEHLEDEVGPFVAGLKHDNGDPVLPEDSKVVGASVRGERDRPQLVTFTIEHPSGRTSKWFAPYDGDELPEAHDAGEDYIRVREAKDRGVVSFDESGHDNSRLRREAAELRRQNEALRSQVEGRAAAEAGEDVPEVEGDTRADYAIAAENDELRQQVAELSERLAQAEGRGPDEPDGEPAAAADEPFEGFDDLKADEVVKRLKDDDTTDEEREAILAYESTHANRKTVVGAANESLTHGD